LIAWMLSKTCFMQISGVFLLLTSFIACGIDSWWYQLSSTVIFHGDLFELNCWATFSFPIILCNYDGSEISTALISSSKFVEVFGCIVVWTFV
jgi:hypothetical protein